MACVTEEELIKICQLGNLEEFKGLYNRNNSILDRKISGLEETPLHLASRFKHMVLVKEILKYGNHMAKARNGEEDTPLHVACRQGEKDIGEQLLNACSFLPYILNKDNQSALFVACSCGHKDLASLLCERMNFSAWDGISASCLRIASSKGYKEIVERILEQNPSSASGRDENGFSAMHFASREGHVDVIEVLLPIVPNLSSIRDNDGRTPLLLAAISGKVNVVNHLLPTSASSTSVEEDIIINPINMADNDGNTILHHAANKNWIKLAKDLVGMAGMNVTTANKQGMTALDILQRQPATSERDDLIKKLIARERVIPKSITAVQQSLLVVAALIVTITFQAGLNPPGGTWQDSNGRNQTSHKPGKAIQSETAPLLFSLFMASDALAFIVSLFLIPIIMILREEIMSVVNLLVVVAIIAMEVAFFLGMFLVSDRKISYRVEVFLLVMVTSVGLGWMGWKLKPLPTCRSTSETTLPSG
ncbi:ankyrin repeat-containing-like protein [Cinnamomum micranthum f. kanehirae]|uniref:Ankyrin repeat-containing-like protein n=1 Tax=Cinnamomum micranthum f. kanehirae TaxID=337451 RepID=A0A3S3Q2Y3_9MAGN|nr:ankyrin repeat-containing-like protein [Cinnamomum micranthum f. kanehirae]